MRLLISILLFLQASILFAQSSDSATHFIVGATYNSGLNYYGRVDSLHSKAFSPFLGLALKNGLYCNANFVFIQNSLQSQYAATIIEAGYNFRDRENHWAGNISASKFIYRPDIDLVQSAIKETGTVSITRMTGIVNITLGGNIKWSDKADFGAQAGLDHIVRIPHIFGDKDIIVLDPTVNAFAGTQNFTQTYYQQKNFLIFPVAEQQVTTTSRQFNLLAYEASMPIVYGYGKLNIIVSPAYVVPQHLIAVPGQPALSENGVNLFYVTASVKLTL